MTGSRPGKVVALLFGLVALLVGAQPAFADSAAFSSATPITICNAANATPYPTTVSVAGMNGTISNVTATLNQFSGGSSDVDVLLVSPAGKTVMLMSDVAIEAAPPGLTFTFDDSAPGPVPQAGAQTGTYKPTNYDLGSFDSDSFVDPAPPYGSALNALNGDSPNGTWKLYVAEHPTSALSPADCSMFPDGSIGGWSINVTTTVPPPPAQTDQQQPQPTTTDQSPNPAPPTDPTAPQVLSANFEKPPVVGEQSLLHVVARDPDSHVTGLIVDFGERNGVFAESACKARTKNTGGTVDFDVPYYFLTAGAKQITITVLSGGCGLAQTSSTTTTVTVGGASSSSVRAHASDTIAGPPITSKCKNSALAPSRASTKLILKALLCVMNEQRKLYKLKPLKFSKRLTKAALAHTRSMILGQFFAHQGPSEPALVTRLRKVKYRWAAGENIGAGAGPSGNPVEMVNGWMHSTLHRANLLSRQWRTVGIGFIALFPLQTTGQPLATYTTDFGVKP